MRTQVNSLKRAKIALNFKERLDAELRKRFGDECGFNTSFNKEALKYTTRYSGDSLTEVAKHEVDSFIDGFYAALDMVLE